MISRRRAMPAPWAMLFLAACCVLSMIITYRAGAQNAGTTAPAAETNPAADAKPAADKPADAPNQPTTAPAKGRAPPSKAEESASIEDDPTLVPDDKESADNNVTFPIDI